MGLSNTGIASAVELAIYIVLLPLTIYLLYKHLRTAPLAYAYLIIFAVLRLTADGLLLSTSDQTSSNYTTALTLESVALSPLLLALLALIHELQKFMTPQYNKIMQIFELLGHISLVAGIALVAAGGSNLVSATTDAERNLAQSLREAGSIILLVVWVILLGLSVLQPLFRSRFHHMSETMVSPPTIAFVLNILAALLVGVRTTYTVAYVFNPSSAALNPITGDFVYHIVFALVIPLLSLLVMLCEGWLTKELPGLARARTTPIAAEIVQDPTSKAPHGEYSA